MDTEQVYSDDPVAIACGFVSAGATRLHIVDLDGAVSGKAVHAALIQKILKNVQIPVQVGGGIRSIEMARAYLDAGASWVILGTSVVQDELLVRTMTSQFPRQIIAGVDSKSGKVAIHGWKEVLPLRTVDLVDKMQTLGIAGLILTDIEKDGMLSGPNFDLYEAITARVGVPVIASGGISSANQIKRLSQIPGVEGAVIGKAFYSGALPLSMLSSTAPFHAC